MKRCIATLAAAAFLAACGGGSGNDLSALDIVELRTLADAGDTAAMG